MQTNAMNLLCPQVTYYVQSCHKKHAPTLLIDFYCIIGLWTLSFLYEDISRFHVNVNIDTPLYNLTKLNNNNKMDGKAWFHI